MGRTSDTLDVLSCDGSYFTLPTSRSHRHFRFATLTSHAWLTIDGPLSCPHATACCWRSGGRSARRVRDLWAATLNLARFASAEGQAVERGRRARRHSSWSRRPRCQYEPNCNRTGFEIVRCSRVRLATICGRYVAGASQRATCWCAPCQGACENLLHGQSAHVGAPHWRIGRRLCCRRGR